MPTWKDMRGASDLRAEHDLRDMRSWALQSQYSASRAILGLASAKQGNNDPTADVSLIHDKILNIHTAEGVGLDNWGAILDIGRTIEGRGGASYTLDDGLYRLLLLYKAMANIASGEIAALNVLLKALCDTGVGGLPKAAYVLEAGVMVLRWVFEAFLTDEQTAVFEAAGTLARPAGVGWEMYFVNPGEVFGFDGSGLLPFNQAPFRPDNSLVTSEGDSNAGS
jgi:hypothetical protein